MNNKRVMDICCQFYEKNDPQGALNALTMEARNIWEQVFFYYYLLFFFFLCYFYHILILFLILILITIFIMFIIG
jgi:hypothetical protein